LHGEEDDTAASVGSQGSPDMLSEDVETDDRARATGWLGSSSDVHWLRKAKQQHFEDTDSISKAPASSGLSGDSPEASKPRRSLRRSHIPFEPISTATYRLDEQEMLTSHVVDPDELPTTEIGNALFGHFMSNVNIDFPFVEVDCTMDRLLNEAILAHDQGKRQSALSYRGLLNIIFAIGASYAHLIGDAQGEERDHFLYFTRARMLALDGGSYVEHPSYQLIQVAALTGFYYLCSSQISR
jgi:hypothetical protein